MYTHYIWKKMELSWFKSHNLFSPFPNKSAEIKKCSRSSSAEKPAGSQRSKAHCSSWREAGFLCQSLVRSTSRRLHFISIQGLKKTICFLYSVQQLAYLSGGVYSKKWSFIVVVFLLGSYKIPLNSFLETWLTLLNIKHTLSPQKLTWMQQPYLHYDFMTFNHQHC